MFAVGDYMMYGKSGVCKVTGICRSPFDEKDDRTYYVLRPVFGAPAIIYTPVDNDKVAFRPLMKADDAHDLIKKIPDIGTLTVENEKMRRDVYKGAVSELYPEGFVSVIKTVYGRRQALASARRHITEADSEYESFAKRALYCELSIVLGIPYDNVENYITEQIEEQKDA